MHEILIYSFTLCLPNGLVTKEPRVGGGGSQHFHAPGCTLGDLGGTDTFVWFLFCGSTGEEALCEVGAGSCSREHLTSH